MNWFKRKKRTSGNPEIRDWDIGVSGYQRQETPRISGYPGTRLSGTCHPAGSSGTGRIPESPVIRNPSSRGSTRNGAFQASFPPRHPRAPRPLHRFPYPPSQNTTDFCFIFIYSKNPWCFGGFRHTSADNPDEYGEIVFSFVYFMFRKGK
ncbi:MAG: hypothetical protein UY82_C0023G0006 [Candidatus Uhrbacteria bacterium GW2011_GWC2_53_7]|uniref:Uncharacterized protein n=1 Tax=Candidatus Uhrbacteria bacterium GW2011_GWC2_53_7 TaxID=1618986 RepID=A0A0G2A6G2_9BACT|nr:MAG: hypothetical protein UY82_C0023G0006 [Candidatus Uhrbacteria bacterium GW2011_GWC2_53_7]